MAWMSGVDTGAVFKHPVRCCHCDEDFYFTLRRIACFEQLTCPQCGSDINLADGSYEKLVSGVKETIARIDQSSPHSYKGHITRRISLLILPDNDAKDVKPGTL